MVYVQLICLVNVLLLTPLCVHKRDIKLISCTTFQFGRLRFVETSNSNTVQFVKCFTWHNWNYKRLINVLLLN